MTAAEIERAFDAADPLAVGVEEELMLLDLETGDLAPRAAEVLELLGGDPRYKLELPASQLEIVSGPCGSVAELGARMASGRAELAAAVDGVVGLGAAGTHPFAAVEGELNPGERYRPTAEGFGRYARRQLVLALQVHVALGSAERTLAVYAGLRSLLPEIAALAANAPFHGGVDTGLASVRPKISESLPRQGVPPPLESWDEYAAALAWGRRSGAMPGDYTWWWELRPHPRFGTLELRVPDAQTTPEAAAAVAAFAHCLVAWLADRADAGEAFAPTPSWRIAENRWWALRDGVEAELADLETGERRPVRELLTEMLGELEPYGRRLECAAELAGVGELIVANGAMRQRAIAAERGLQGLIGWLRERFTAPRLD